MKNNTLQTSFVLINYGARYSLCSKTRVLDVQNYLNIKEEIKK